jgi:hypothetical protein
MTQDNLMPFNKTQNKLTDYKIKYMKYKIKFLTLREEMEGGSIRRSSIRRGSMNRPNNLPISLDYNLPISITSKQGYLIDDIYNTFEKIPANVGCYSLSNPNPPGCTNYHTTKVIFTFRNTENAIWLTQNYAEMQKNDTYQLISTPQKGDNAMYPPQKSLFRNNEDVTHKFKNINSRNNKNFKTVILNVILLNVTKQIQ